MPRICTICRHDERAEIDRAIVAQAASYRDIAGQFAVSKSAVERHASGHVAAAIARAAEHADVTAGQLVGELRTLREVTIGILAEARGEGDHSAALGAIARLERQAELCARLAGELVERREVSVRALVFDAEWVRLRSLLFSSLQPFPDALAAVRSALALPEVPDAAA